MVWWKRFFKKKTEPVEEDDWEQVVDDIAEILDGKTE